jgi:hypothetical protein
MLNGFDEHRDNAWNGGSRILVAFEAPLEFLADPQTAQAGFSCGPEEISLSGEMAEDRNFAKSCQSRDLIRTTGSETLPRE